MSGGIVDVDSGISAEDVCEALTDIVGVRLTEGASAGPSDRLVEALADGNSEPLGGALIDCVAETLTVWVADVLDCVTDEVGIGLGVGN